MEISKGIDIIDTALWIKQEKVLVINDLHLGYEETLYRKGILVPRFQIDEIIKRMNAIFVHVSPEKVIINGDLKHEFGTVLKQEWKEVLQFIDFLLLNVKEVVIIKGNHDPVIKFIAEKRGVTVVTEFSVGDILIIHGDKIVETEAKRMIIGHEHPAIMIREGSKYEKFKCFLKGKWKRKELLVVPSFNPLVEGTDILREKLLSPFLEDIERFEVYVSGREEVFYFGKVNKVREIVSPRTKVRGLN